jgi:periplasmic protein TonB
VLLKRELSPVLAWALVASIALHAAALVLPALVLPRALRVHDAAATFLTARLEPRAPDESAPPPEVLKNTIEPRPERPRAEPKPPRTASPAAAPPKPRPPPERLSGEVLDRTLGQLSQTLLYPPEAVQRGLEGEVVVMLELDANGRVVAASVASGSGHAILDEAAVRAARQLGTLGPALAGKAILLPVRFRLI